MWRKDSSNKCVSVSVKNYNEQAQDLPSNFFSLDLLSSASRRFCCLQYRVLMILKINNFPKLTISTRQ